MSGTDSRVAEAPIDVEPDGSLRPRRYAGHRDDVLGFGGRRGGVAWRRPDIYRASPIARNALLGIPLITVSAGAFAVSLIFCLYQWVSRDVYGINNPASFRYLADLYALALVIYVGFRLIRRAQGMDLKMVYGEIPEE